MMTVDFEALDFVRSQNKSRSYNKRKRINELQKQNTDLQKLVADAIEMVKENEKDNFQAYSCILKARLEKIKKRG